jgi:hypothetical protein
MTVFWFSIPFPPVGKVPSACEADEVFLEPYAIALG